MGPLVGAGIGAALGAVVCGLVLLEHWSYLRKQREVGNAVGYSVIGGGVLGAIIGLFL
jgi:hypothetical protein